MLRSALLYAPPGSGLSPIHRTYLEDASCKIRRPASKERYATTWRILQNRYPGKRFNEFTEQDLVDFILTDDAGRPRRPGQDGWREWTVLTHLSAIVCIFSWGFKRNMIADDPSKNLRQTFAWVHPRTHRTHIWLKLPEVEQMLASVSLDSPLGVRDHTLLQFLIGSGVRRDEAVKAAWRHVVDLDADHAELHVADGKGNKERYVPLTMKTGGALRRWRLVSEREAGGLTPDAPLFPAAHNIGRPGATADVRIDWSARRKPLGRQGIADVVARAGAAIGRPALRPHDLRRSYAGLLEDAQVSIQDISRNLGHSSVDTTLKYLADNSSKRARSVANVGF